MNIPDHRPSNSKPLMARLDAILASTERDTICAVRCPDEPHHRSPEGVRAALVPDVFHPSPSMLERFAEAIRPL